MENYLGKEIRSSSGLPLTDSYIRERISADKKGIKTRIRAAMKNSEYDTQAKLAAALGTEREYLSAQINQKSRPMSINILSGIADALDCSVEYILGMKKDPHAPEFKEHADILNEYLFSFGFELHSGQMVIRDQYKNIYALPPSVFDRLGERIDRVTRALIDDTIQKYRIESTKTLKDIAEIEKILFGDQTQD